MLKSGYFHCAPGIVIAARRVELDACIEQRLVRLLESHAVRLRRAVAVVVVAKHQHEVEADILALRRELRGCFALRGAPLAGIADDGKLQRKRFESERRLRVAGDDLKVRSGMSKLGGAPHPAAAANEPERADKCGRRANPKGPPPTRLRSGSTRRN